MVELSYSASELEAIRAYRGPLDVWLVVELVGFLILGIVFTRWAPRPLFRWAEATALSIEKALPSLASRLSLFERLWGGPGCGASVLFALAVDAFGIALTLPGSIAFRFFHDRAFGVSHETAAHFALNLVKGSALSIAAFASLGVGLFGLFRRTPHAPWLLGFAGAALLGASVILEHQNAGVYVDHRPLTEEPLATEIQALAARAQVNITQTVVAKTSVMHSIPTAQLSGTPDFRTMTLNDTLLETCSRDEILAAVAHELGHANESRTAGAVYATLCLFALLWGVRALMRRAARDGWWGISTVGDVRLLPLLMTVFAVLTNFVSPLALAASRERESAADRFATGLTHKPNALASVLMKNARASKTDPDPPQWVVWLSASHPPLRQRLADLVSDAGPVPPSPTP